MPPQQSHNIVSSPLILPIGTCRRRRPDRMVHPSTTITTHNNDNNTPQNSSGIDTTSFINSVIPSTCRFILVYQSTDNEPTPEDPVVDDPNHHHHQFPPSMLPKSSTTTTPSSPSVSLLTTKAQSTTLPVWYLCRILVADKLFTTNDDTNFIDDCFYDDATLEYFECALNVTLMGYNPTLSSPKRIETSQHDYSLQKSTSTTIPTSTGSELIPVRTIRTNTTVTEHVETILIRPTQTSSGSTSDDVHRNEVYLMPLSDQQPVPIASVFMTYQSSTVRSSSSVSPSHTAAALLLSLSNQPLLQSCLKRQLVGCNVGIWNNGINTKKTPGIIKTTKIQFSFEQIMWTFMIDSITAGATPTYVGRGNDDIEFHIGIISPSTRITFLHPIITSALTKSNPTSMTPSLPSDSPSRTTSTNLYKSPAVRILLDAIHCINCIQNLSCSSSSLKLPIFGNVPRAFLLSGPPGVGKTHAIRTVVNAISAASASPIHKDSVLPACKLIVLQGSEILAAGQQYSDASKALERHFHQAVQQMRNNTNITIIFLDECDALLSSTNPNEPSSFIIESTLGRLLDKMNNVSITSGGDPVYLRLIVVAATNRVDAIPSTLRRPGRFDREVPMVPPDATTRFQIIQSLVTSHEESTDVDVVDQRLTYTEMRDIADLCVGFVPADLAAVVRKVELLRVIQVHEALACRSRDAISAVSNSQFELWTRAISEVGASALRDAALTAPPATKWNDVAGDPGGAKTALRQAIEWPRTKRAAYERLGLTPPRGILLHGPPGCAKTTLARAAAGASAVSFLSLSPADVYSTSYVGDAEAVIRRAFTLARSASPCVLFFDEIDAILGMDENHSSHHSGMGRGSAVEARVLSTFLNEMDGVDGSWKDGVLVLGATNRPWTLDTALLRPGRFDKVIYVPPPDFDGRREIISMHCHHWSKHIAEGTIIDMDRLASDTVSGNMTGAEIVGACREAAMLCFREAMAVHTTTDDATASTSPTTRLVMKQSYLETALMNVRPLLSNPSIMEDFQSFQLERTRKVGSE